MPFAEGERKKIGFVCPLGKRKLFKFANRRLAAGKLEIDFKKPWNYLHFLPAEARAAGEGEAEHSSNRIWWCLLEKVRTHFEKNPQADF